MDNSQSSILFIQTVNGPKLLKDFKGEFVLPYEHISQNLTNFQYNHDKYKFDKSAKKSMRLLLLIICLKTCFSRKC